VTAALDVYFVLILRQPYTNQTMKLELDHFFILTDNPQKTGDLLVSLGLNESFRRDHPGQGTSNRRFEFSNGMLEILYVRDEQECLTGPARGLGFPERVSAKQASPFGIILTRTEGGVDDRPFKGWHYQPDYFEPPNGFHIGINSDNLNEPLCIYVPFMGPIKRNEEVGTFKSVSLVEVFVPTNEPSETLRQLDFVDRLAIKTGREHLIVLTLDDHKEGLSKDFRPDIPLVIQW